jgi:predicted SnoaL-like aldol condensation-catalyzing enzyme
METMAVQSKRLVLDAFDTLFNKRDYTAAEKFWSPHYIQHSAHIEPGREGLFNFRTVKKRDADVREDLSFLKYSDDHR